ncbi:MAG: protoheme IX farnesyltransferase [Deltaproteobacteria bacterium]|nr:protoheme IX farnesyltransferase [Deltaproteobacteria bacterium]MBW2576530.1 protoheme IX farnesyltransferase [Deltaproteobacteria bacterium]MBW2691803.1 protoheme IX farnesyltransferase [Deltaproteobacteria bacterium]
MSADSRVHIALGDARSRFGWLARVQDYVALTRPRVLTLVLFTAPPAMVMGHEGWPSAAVILGVIFGAALIGAGCGALNASWERDRDRRMARTENRPLPAGRLTLSEAVIFGFAISALGVAVLFAAGGWLPAAIGVLTLVHYLLIYTIWLKPRTPQNIVIGGAAGAASPLIADAAIDGRLGLWGFVLFLIVFVWTPPHFWAIALYRKREYAAAGFPMLPNVLGDRATRKHMLAYAIGLIPVALIPWIGGELSFVYALTAVIAGGGFIASIARSMRVESPKQDRRVFKVSIFFLFAIFAEMLVELTLR